MTSTNTNTNTENSGTAPFDPARIERAYEKFIQGLGERALQTLCYNGSIWIDLDDAQSGLVEPDSFRALGIVNEGVTTEYGYSVGLIPFVSFDGLAEKFVFPTDVDEDGKLLQPQHGQVIFTPESARAELLSCSVEGDLDRLKDRLANLRESVVG